jgi:hypothetical protein
VTIRERTPFCGIQLCLNNARNIPATLETCQGAETLNWRESAAKALAPELIKFYERPARVGSPGIISPLQLLLIYWVLLGLLSGCVTALLLVPVFTVSPFGDCFGRKSIVFRTGLTLLFCTG